MTSTLPPHAPPAFHVMLKPRGALCNLDCAYCFFLSKEALYPDSDFRMSDELLENYTRQYIEAQRVPEVTFAWQGGEPTLMGLEFFQRAVALQARYKKPGMTLHNAFQTNGVLVDDAWAAFFKAHNFLVGISLDGPRALHDAYRVDKGGQPTFERVMRGLAHLKQHGVDYNVLTCVHAANADYPLDVYHFLRDEVGTQFMQFIPIVERANATGFQQGAAITDRSVNAAQYGHFLNSVFDTWVRRDVGRVFVQIFDVALAAWAGLRPGLCVFEPTCGAALALEHNGDVYACDHFVEPDYWRGNIQQERLIDLVGSAAQHAFGQAKQADLPHYCRECDVRFVCNGGCPKDRTLTTPDGEPGLNYLCAGYKAFFKHVDAPMRYMAQELAHRRAPASVMAYMTQLDAQRPAVAVGRNDPCPCGSGRKYKHCCGRSGRRK